MDKWLGEDGLKCWRERQLKEVIRKHSEADEADVDRLEGLGALNFLALDDLPVSHEGELLPDFDSMAMISGFVADTIAIPEIARDEDYGLIFQGHVQVPYDGVYAFSISSDDGSRLSVADTLLVDNDGLHGDYEMTGLTGLIGLKAGYHRIVAHMFQHKGGEALPASIAGSSLSKQPISAGILYRERQ